MGKPNAKHGSLSPALVPLQTNIFTAGPAGRVVATIARYVCVEIAMRRFHRTGVDRICVVARHLTASSDIHAAHTA